MREYQVREQGHEAYRRIVAASREAAALEYAQERYGAGAKAGRVNGDYFQAQRTQPDGSTAPVGEPFHVF